MDIRTQVKVALQKEIDSITMPNSVVLWKECLVSPDLAWEYYIKNDYSTAWLNPGGISSIADTLAEILKYSTLDGLNPNDFHSDFISSCLKDSVAKWVQKNNYQALANMELLLTDAFITYAASEYAGFVHFEDNNVGWENHMGEISCIDSLQKVKENGNIRDVLDHFYCNLAPYLQLKRALQDYFKIKKAGGWPLLPGDAYLKAGDTGNRISLLYKRLLATGEIQAGANDKPDTFYNTKLEEGVKQFQEENGIPVDGILNRNVVKAMNISVDERIMQITENMERWRWLPHNLKQPYIMVNIASFSLDLVDSGKSVMTMKIIVGKPYTRTPLFQARMTYLILNPWWEIPIKIARKEIVPEIKKDTSYLSKNDIKIYSDWSKDAKEIPADSIKWDSIVPSRFSYRLRQSPGDKNALGKIKFMFPNKYDVYLHDTPQRNLFDRTVRTFSHGCIRIEDPLDLAVYLLKDDPNWTRDSIVTAIDSNTEQTILLPLPVDVYVCYWTTWVNENGRVCFRPDVYYYDKRLKESFDDPLYK